MRGSDRQIRRPTPKGPTEMLDPGLRGHLGRGTIWYCISRAVDCPSALGFIPASILVPSSSSGLSCCAGAWSVVGMFCPSPTPHVEVLCLVSGVISGQTGRTGAAERPKPLRQGSQAWLRESGRWLPRPASGASLSVLSVGRVPFGVSRLAVASVPPCLRASVPPCLRAAHRLSLLALYLFGS